MNKLKGENLKKVYSRNVVAIENVDIEIEKREIVVIFGPSGSGKTTLLNLLGLLDKPTEGNVILDDMVLNNIDEKKAGEIRNRKFGFIFQFFYLIPELTVVENIILPLWIKEKRAKLKQFYKNAEELLKSFDLIKKKDFYPTQLSGGENQRVAICRSLICEQEIIFADEPTGSIDKFSSEIFFRTIKKLNEEKGTTFVIATHNENFLQISSKVVYLKEGKIEKRS
ncbi:ABC transporter ATP-binding protein [bacterium]|nr:ABC transporter ATP-binding protein [bacterium]